MRSISARLTLRFALISGILLAVFAASLYAWIKQGLADRLQRDLAARFAMFQERFTAESGGTPKEVGDELRSFLSTAGAAAEIRGPQGIIFQSPGYREDLPGFHTIRGRVAAISGESFEASFSLQELPYREPLRQLRLYFALIGLPGLVIASLVGYTLARRALRPVEEIRRQAERISRANLTERVPLPSSKDGIHD